MERLHTGLKTMILKIPAFSVLLALMTFTAYGALAAKLPPLVKIISARGATYFIDAGKISGIVNSYVLIPEKTIDPGRLGLHSGPIKPHLLGIPGFPRGIAIDGDAKHFIKNNHLESTFVTLHQATSGPSGAMDGIERLYVKASAVSVIEIPNQNKPVCRSGAKKPID